MLCKAAALTAQVCLYPGEQMPASGHRAFLDLLSSDGIVILKIFDTICQSI